MSKGVCGVIVLTTRRKTIKNIGILLNMIKSTIKMEIFTRERLDNHFQLNFERGGMKKIMEDACNPGNLLL